MNPFAEFTQGMIAVWANAMLSQYVVTARFLCVFSALPVHDGASGARPLSQEYTAAPELGANVLRLTRAFHSREQR